MTTEDIIKLIVTATLCLVVLAVTFVLLAGLYDSRIENAEIFKMLAPPFSMIVGAFVGYMAGKRDSKP